MTTPSQPAADKATQRLSILEAIPHAPATDDELNAYARGIVEKIMVYPTPNCVASLLARIREDNATIRCRSAAVEGLVTVLGGFIARCPNCFDKNCKDLLHEEARAALAAVEEKGDG